MVRAYWDFRDQVSTDEGLLLMNPRIVILSCFHGEYLERLHHGHLSATKVQQNACQHLYWPRLDADIIDYTRRCQECIHLSLPPKKQLQSHDVPQQPWECIVMNYFYVNCSLHILICDYFSKFPFLFQTKTMSFANLKDHLQELFSIEGTPKEIMSNNGPPLMAKNSVLILQVLASDTPPHHQTTHIVMASSRDRSRQSFQEALTSLRAMPLEDGLPSPAEILHERSLVTRKAREVNAVALCQSLIALQVKYTKSHEKVRQAKDQ